MERKQTRCAGRIKARGCIEGTVTRLRAGPSGVRISAGTTDFSPLRNAKTDCGTHQASSLMSLRGSFSREGHESDNSSSSSLRAGVKNEWTYTFTPPIRLYGMYLEKFIVFTSLWAKYGESFIADAGNVCGNDSALRG